MFKEIEEVSDKLTNAVINNLSEKEIAYIINDSIVVMDKYKECLERK